MDVWLMGWKDCFDSFGGDDDLCSTGYGEVKVWVDMKTKMVNRAKVIKMGEKLL